MITFLKIYIIKKIIKKMKSSRSNSNFSNNSSGSTQRPNSNFKNFQSNTTAFPSKKSKRSKDSYTEIALEKENYQNSLNKTNNSNRKSLSNIPPISIKSEIRRGSVLPFSSTLQTLNQKYDLNESIISTRTQKDNKNNNILLTERRNTMALSRNDILNRSEILNNSEIELNKNNKKRNSNLSNLTDSLLSEKKRMSKRLSQILEPEKKIYQGMDLNKISNSSHRSKRKSAFFQGSDIDNNETMDFSTEKKKRRKNKSKINLNDFYYDENGNLIYLDDEKKKKI